MTPQTTERLCFQEMEKVMEEILWDHEDQPSQRVQLNSRIDQVGINEAHHRLA